MIREKEIVEPSAALEETPEAVAQAEEVAAAKPAESKFKWRFQKRMSPWEPIKVKGKEIVFHRPKKQNGTFAAHGDYICRDRKEAKALQEWIKQNPNGNVIEVL